MDNNFTTEEALIVRFIDSMPAFCRVTYKDLIYVVAAQLGLKTKDAADAAADRIVMIIHGIVSSRPDVVIVPSPNWDAAIKKLPE